MRHGEISNHTAPIIAFNVDNLLYAKSSTPSGLASRLFRSFFDSPTSSPDLRFIKLLYDIWNGRAPYSIYLFTRREEERKIAALAMYLEEYNAYYTSLRTIKPLREMQFFIANQCRYFFDTDREYLVSLGTENARHISEIGQCIGLGYSFPMEGE